MVDIECLVCGKTIEIPQFIDTNNYDGQIACQECASLLHIKLVGSKVRKYKVVEKKFRSLSPNEKVTDSNWEAERELKGQTGEQEADVEKIAKYNPLRDYLATYRANQLHLAFEQIEGIIGCKLEAGAYTFKSWWENDRRHAQAIAWLEAGWQVIDVNLPQQEVIFRRELDTIGRPHNLKKERRHGTGI
jgi:DNA-directed RNA polymerase subunit RPC12/RpoP